MRTVAYKARSGDVFDVSNSDEASLALLSERGFLFISDDFARESRASLHRVYKTVTGHKTQGDKGFLEGWLDNLIKNAKPYFTAKVEVPTKGTLVTLEIDPAEAENIPKQAVGILVCLNANGGVLEIGQLCDTLKEFVTSKQPMAEIFRFYRKKLLELGYIKVEEKK